jgi:RimJ/RimL family protein N-acetyltransferase
MKIILLPFCKNDIEYLIKWVDRPGATDLWASNTYPFPLTRKIVLAHLKKTGQNPFRLLIFKAIVKQPGKPVGHCELDHIDHSAKSARITRLFVDQEFRNMGVATAMTKLLLKHCFQTLNLNRVEINAVEINEKALRLYEGLGFRREGFLRENMFLSGKRYGTYILSMLKADYYGLPDSHKTTSSRLDRARRAKQENRRQISFHQTKEQSRQ